MYRTWTMTIPGALAAAMVFATSVAADTRCPEGRTFSGECVNPAFAQAMRKHAIVYTQPKFSYTAPLVLPIEDFGYRIAPHWHEILNLFTYPSVSTTAPTRP
jgi:hypothetical protein